MSSILIVEDEPRIVAFLTKGLKAAGFAPHTTSTGLEAVELALQTNFDLIILDVGLPDIDGFEVLQRLLTARSSVADRVAGLEGGADDYMPKPFSFEELLARIRVRLRPEAAGADQMRLTHRDMVLDLRTRALTLEGRTVELSAREFALAETFMRHPGQVLSREQLLSAVWGLDFDPGSNVVEVYVSYLRNKLGRDRVETVRGMGYRLT